MIRAYIGSVANHSGGKNSLRQNSSGRAHVFKKKIYIGVWKTLLAKLLRVRARLKTPGRKFLKHITIFLGKICFIFPKN